MRRPRFSRTDWVLIAWLIVSGLIIPSCVIATHENTAEDWEVYNLDSP